MLWKNCLLGSRSVKKGYKADGTSYTGTLEDAKDRDDICGGPDLEKRGLPQLPVMVIWDLEGWSPVDLGLEGPHMNLKKKSASQVKRGPYLSSADGTLKYCFPWQRCGSKQLRCKEGDLYPHLG